MKTARQIQWSNELRPACLPQPQSSDFSGKMATVAGWGFTNEDRGIGMLARNLEGLWVRYSIGNNIIFKLL